MNYLKVKNWEKWQSYRNDRGQPPWIKIHRRILRNPEWVSLSDAEKGQLISIWLLAADKDGLIPDSPALIQKLCLLSKPPNLNKFIGLDFVSSGGCRDDDNLTPNGSQDDQPKAEAKAEKNRYMDYVLLTSEEYDRLLEDYGENSRDRMIDKLDNYIGQNTKKNIDKYTDHNRVLRGWVADALGIEKINKKLDNTDNQFYCKFCKKIKTSMVSENVCTECSEKNKS